MDFKTIKDLFSAMKGGEGINIPLVLAALCIGVAVLYLILAFV